MKSTVLVSDGNHTIGYIEGRQPAQWEGNNTELQPGQHYDIMQEGAVFGINTQDDYIVENGEWKEQ